MGAGCVCAANLYVASTSHRFRDLPYLPIRWQDGLVGSLPLEAQSERIVIEDDCWLGINVVICPGVTLGRGTVVGANSVVTNSTFPYSVVGGAPARLIGTRLAFQPPTSIHSSQQEDIPYFYAGFEVLPTEESWRSASVRGRGVGQRFALALRLEKGELLSLTLHSAAGARLTHGLQEIAIPEGDSTSMIEPHPDMRGLLWFYVNGWSPGCIAIKSAYAIELATSAEAPIPC
ncbi:MAG: acyltransferase [Candidatus Saccharibacteria bacterium]|nr:acyltransferase [Rhodoferax sp.]